MMKHQLRYLKHSKSRIKHFSTKPFQYNYDINKLYSFNYNNAPILPLPSLMDTLKSYKRSVTPLGSTKELDDVDKAINGFVNGIGQQLQADLLAIEAETAKKGVYPYSYVEKYWDEMYLGGRWSTPVNSNPFYILSQEGNYFSPTNRAAQFVFASVQFWLKVVNGKLEADIDPSTGKALCMYQFSNMMGTTRVCGPSTDSHELNPFSEHIVVAVNSRYYKLRVIKDGLPINPAHLEVELDRIKGHAMSQSIPEVDVGLLTAQDRDTAYSLKSSLETIPINKQSMEVLDKCLFVLTLDDNESTDINHLAKVALTGVDGKNRWFDKHNVIVDNNSELLINFEHAAGDGLTWNRWMTEAWYNMNKLINDKYPYAPFSKDTCIDASDLSTELQWAFTDQHKVDFKKAEADFKEAIENVDYNVMSYDEYGKSTAKSWKVSPDALAQMAMQLGFHHTVGTKEVDGLFRGVPVYEACAMKSYFHGRTETIRSCSSESTEMSRLFSSTSATTDEKRSAFQAACKTHVNLAKGAKMCKGEYMGVDRHLYALKCLAQEQGKQLDDIPLFADPLFSRSSTWILSTSNVTTPFFRLFGFGPTASQGYGIGYQTFDNELPFCITSFKNTQQATSKDYTEGIIRALDEFRTVHN